MQESKLKNYLIMGLLGVIGLLLLVRGCETPEPREVFLKGSEIVKYDTVKNTDTLVEFKTRFYPKYDTIKLADTTWNADLCNFERVYSDSIADTNITIYNTISTIGVLKYSKVSYRWKKPEVIKNIYRTDTVVKSSRFSLYTGLELAGSQTSFNASPYISLNYKKTNIGVSYGLLDKSIGVRVGFRVFSSRR